MEPLNLSVRRASEGLGVSERELSDVVTEKTGISAEMAVRLSKAFGSSPETWLGMQMAYDLWHTLEAVDEIAVESFVDVAASP